MNKSYTSRPIFLVTYVGPEWQIPVVCMDDEEEVKAHVANLNAGKDKILGNGTEDRPHPKLSTFQYQRINLTECHKVPEKRMARRFLFTVERPHASGDGSFPQILHVAEYSDRTHGHRSDESLRRSFRNIVRNRFPVELGDPLSEIKMERVQEY